ncbi:MAG: hypothetical protein JRD93_10615 [Deltaproteobacteria bacterium]|nr:hypothetical protein [Deltaproteobacteria bacterium]
MSFLPEFDQNYLQEKGFNFKEASNNGNKGIIISGFVLPEGKYDQDKVDLLILLPQGYPDISPDMFYLFPAVVLMPGKQTAKAANVKFNFENIEWQRWSRHSPGPTWRPGIDGLHTYLKKVETALQVAEP